MKNTSFSAHSFQSGAAAFEDIATKLGRNVALVHLHNIKPKAFKLEQYKYKTRAAAVTIWQRRNTKNTFSLITRLWKEIFWIGIYHNDGQKIPDLLVYKASLNSPIAKSRIIEIQLWQPATATGSRSHEACNVYFTYLWVLYPLEPIPVELVALEF